MNVRVCDVCYKKDKKLVKAPRGIRMKGRSYLNLALCDKCIDEVPSDTKKYVKFVHSLDGIDISDEEVATILRR